MAKVKCVRCGVESGYVVMDRNLSGEYAHKDMTFCIESNAKREGYNLAITEAVATIRNIRTRDSFQAVWVDSIIEKILELKQ